MEKLIHNSDSLADLSQEVLAENGVFHRSIPGYKPRDGQISLTKHVSLSISSKTHLIAEAGTGIGKSFAYLIPSVLSQKKIIISTATKALQDQLYFKDIPLIKKLLKRLVRIENLKGRANYICLYRLKLYTDNALNLGEEGQDDLHFIRDNLARLKKGDKAELPEIPDTSHAWPYATSTADNCLGSNCPDFKTCFLVKNRKKALDADIVIINHHLFFADSKLKEQGFGELLPGVNAVIFDEAHQLASVATVFYEQTFSTREIDKIFDEVAVLWPKTDQENYPFKALKNQYGRAINALRLLLTHYEGRIPIATLVNDTQINSFLCSVLQILSDMLHVFESIELSLEVNVIKLKNNVENIQQLLSTMLELQTNHIGWIELFKSSIVFHLTPIDISEAFLSMQKKLQSTFIFTSATLAINQSFDCFKREFGLTDANELVIESPFNFKKNALLYLPRKIPDIKHDDYFNALIAQSVPVIKACDGRCFFLFTSFKALNYVAEHLKNHVSNPVLVQGHEANAILLARFRKLGNAVLLGTTTFWEGIDVKGEALSCVIIDKLPFSNPHDPITRGKIDSLERQGFSSFNTLSLPNAIIALKQGVGRLIRDVDDKGVLMIADPRLTSREYGRLIFASLPVMDKTRDLNKVLHFIKNGFSYESSCV